MKKVLIIAHNFPPCGGGGVRRVLNFVKFLPQYGWAPIVLTVKHGVYLNYDSDLLTEVANDVEMYRARTFEKLAFKMEGNIYKRSKDTNVVLGLKDRMIRKMKDLVGAPDKAILWAPFAVLEGIKVIKRRNPDVIYSTAPPFSDHIVGLILKKLTWKPLIVDFRDAWVANPTHYWGSPLRRRIETHMERTVVHCAESVIAVTEGVRENFQRRYSTENPSKFIFLPNGYNKDDFADIKPKTKLDDKVRIVYTGILYSNRTPKYFLEALRLLLNEYPKMENHLEVLFIGQNLPFDDGKTIHEYIKQWNLTKVVKTLSFLSRRETLEYQLSADILLLIIGIVPHNLAETYGLAGKTFEYVMAKKPIFTLANPDGPVGEFIRDANIGVAIEPEDALKIKNNLFQWISQSRLGELVFKPRQEIIEKYNFKKITSNLVKLFNSVIKGM